jgi:hypothetical protein
LIVPITFVSRSFDQALAVAHSALIVGLPRRRGSRQKRGDSPFLRKAGSGYGSRWSGYRAELGTVSVAPGDEALHANLNNTRPPTRIPAPSDQSEEELSTADTGVLLVATLIEFAIIADALSPWNRCAASIDGTDPQGHARSPAHRPQTKC